MSNKKLEGVLTLGDFLEMTLDIPPETPIIAGFKIRNPVLFMEMLTHSKYGPVIALSTKAWPEDDGPE